MSLCPHRQLLVKVLLRSSCKNKHPQQKHRLGSCWSVAEPLTHEGFVNSDRACASLSLSGYVKRILRGNGAVCVKIPPQKQAVRRDGSQRLYTPGVAVELPTTGFSLQMNLTGAAWGGTGVGVGGVFHQGECSPGRWWRRTASIKLPAHIIDGCQH